jgi:hypothetical protein
MMNDTMAFDATRRDKQIGQNRPSYMFASMENGLLRAWSSDFKKSHFEKGNIFTQITTQLTVVNFVPGKSPRSN